MWTDDVQLWGYTAKINVKTIQKFGNKMAIPIPIVFVCVQHLLELSVATRSSKTEKNATVDTTKSNAETNVATPA